MDAIYREEVQGAIDRVVEMAEQAEKDVGQWSLSSWYGSVCAWIREREKASMGFTLTLPDPRSGGEPLIIIEVKDPTTNGGPSGAGEGTQQYADPDPQLGDDHVEWDPEDPKSVANAKKKFDAALKKGGKAFKVYYEKVKKTGDPITEFDPSLKEILIVPQMAGG